MERERNEKQRRDMKQRPPERWCEFDEMFDCLKLNFLKLHFSLPLEMRCWRLERVMMKTFSLLLDRNSSSLITVINSSKKKCVSTVESFEILAPSLDENKINWHEHVSISSTNLSLLIDNMKLLCSVVVVCRFCFCISIKRRLERSCLTILIFIQHQFLVPWTFN